MNTSGNALVKHPQSGRKDLTGLLHPGIPLASAVIYGDKRRFRPPGPTFPFLKVSKPMSFFRFRTTTFGIILKIGFP